MVYSDLKTISMTACLACLAFPLLAPLIVSFCRVFLGTLYPAYASYKAIRNKDVKEYVSPFFSSSSSGFCLSKFLIWIAGQVDDVLDRLRSLHHRRDDHRHIFRLLVNVSTCLN